MNIDEFSEKYIQSLTSVFQPTPPENITDATMRDFAMDIRKVFETENVEDSTDDEMVKRIGFYRNGLFTGVEIIYYRQDNFIFVNIFRNDNIIFSSNDEDENYLNSITLINCTNDIPSLLNLNDNNIISKRLLYEGISRVVTTGITNYNSYILLPNTHTRSTKNKKFFVQNSIIQSVQTTYPDFSFFYDYSYLSNNEDALGDEFEIYFRAHLNGSVYFSTFNYDYFHNSIPVDANKYYKLNICMMPKYGYTGEIPSVWANLIEIAEPLEN